MFYGRIDTRALFEGSCVDHPGIYSILMFRGFLRPSRTNFVFHQMTRKLWNFEGLVFFRVIDIHVIRSLGDMLQHKCLESEDVLVAVLKGIE